MEPEEAAVERQAINLLFTTRGPLQTETLASAVGGDEAVAASLVAQMESEGGLLRDEDGRIVAVTGLSVVPTRHEFVVAGVRRWTWCAWDALGLVALLGQGGTVQSDCPQTGAPITVTFEDGRVTPDPAAARLLLADRPKDCVTVRDWCPLVNLFSSAEAAQVWMQRAGVSGRLQQVDEAAANCAEDYRPLLRVDC